MEEIKAQLNVIEERMGRLQTDFHALDKQAALTSQSVATLANNMALLTEAVGTLKGVAERWRGVIIACLFLGPIVGAIAGILVRVLLFGEPISDGHGLIK